MHYYATLKAEILARLGLSPVTAAQQFNAWSYTPGVLPQAQMTQLQRVAERWLQLGKLSGAAIVDRVVMDRFLRAVPGESKRALGAADPATPRGMVELIECADANLSMWRFPRGRGPT